MEVPAEMVALNELFETPLQIWLLPLNATIKALRAGTLGVVASVDVDLRNMPSVAAMYIASRSASKFRREGQTLRTVGRLWSAEDETTVPA